MVLIGVIVFFKQIKESHFYKNYSAHQNRMNISTEGLYREFLENDQFYNHQLMKNCLKKISFFRPMINRYDYLDEFYDAFYFPLKALKDLVIELLLVIVDLSMTLLNMSIGNDAEEDQVDLEDALNHLVDVFKIFAFTSFVFVNSAISIITRPVLTLAMGFASKGDPRYAFDDKEARDEMTLGSDFNLQGCF